MARNQSLAPRPIADQIDILVLAIEHGGEEDRAYAAKRLRDIAEQVRALEAEDGPVPNRDSMDGTARLCRALYGRKERASDYLGGSDCRMLHDAADRIAELETRDYARLSAIAASGPLADSAHSRAPHVLGPVAEVFGEGVED